MSHLAWQSDREGKRFSYLVIPQAKPQKNFCQAVLGIYDRCTPGLAAEVSLLAAMLGSLHEAHDVLASRGVELDTKTVRLIAYRYAARARLAPQIDQAGFEDTVAGRRVVISSDGGRLRLRETKRGAKTTKGRKRYTGAWREPKVLIIYVVDAAGKRDASCAPVIDATLQGPDAVFALLRTYLQRLAITQADQGLFIADGAPWIWKRVQAGAPNRLAAKASRIIAGLSGANFVSCSISGDESWGGRVPRPMWRITPFSGSFASLKSG